MKLTMVQSRAALFLLIMAACLAGCSGGSDGSAGSTLSGISVTPANSTIAKGSSRQFTATGIFSNGSSQNMTTQVVWSSSNSGVATITSNGRAVSVDLGTTTITALYTAETGSLTGTTKLTVAVTAGANAVIKVPSTGQLASYSSPTTFDDGKLQRGVAWPSPRFTNADGSTPVSGSVIVDQLTGLMWTKDANAPGPAICTPAGARLWQAALDYAACLNANRYLDFSDWRLPNRDEMKSLVNYGQANPAAWLTGRGFSNVQARGYWTSTSFANNPVDAWFVDMSDGKVKNAFKTDGTAFVWPVRAGK